MWKRKSRENLFYCFITDDCYRMYFYFYTSITYILKILGAAIWTVLSQSVVVITSFLLLYIYKNEKSNFVWDKEMIKEILSIGVSVSGLSIATLIVLIFINL